MECIINRLTKLKKAITRKKTSIRNKAFMKRVKLFLGCQLCGYKEYACALQFDHIDPKNKLRMISAMQGYSMNSLKNEMRKCRVLCANCHAVHSEVQRKNAENKPNN